VEAVKKFEKHQAERVAAELKKDMQAAKINNEAEARAIALEITLRLGIRENEQKTGVSFKTHRENVKRYHQQLVDDKEKEIEDMIVE